MSKQPEFRKVGNRGVSMLRRDMYRLFRTPLLYWMTAFSAVLPGSFEVMMGLKKGFNAWGQVSSLFSSALFFIMGILLAFFIGNDFNSGFIKNVCCITPKLRVYTFSKVVTGGVIGLMLLIGYVLGAGIFGAAAGGSFTVGATFEMLAAFIGKLAMMLLFSGIFTIVDVFMRGRPWFAVMGSLVIGMLFMPTLLISIGSPFMMAGLSIAAGIISILVFPGVAASIMKQRDII